MLPRLPAWSDTRGAVPVTPASPTVCRANFLAAGRLTELGWRASTPVKVGLEQNYRWVTDRLASGAPIRGREGALPRTADTVEPSREHLSCALQVFWNADVDEVASQDLRAQELLANQLREHVLLKRDRGLTDGFEDAA